MYEWMDSVSLRYSFCGKLDGWMDGWMDSVSLRYRKDGWMDKCKFEVVLVVSLRLRLI